MTARILLVLLLPFLAAEPAREVGKKDLDKLQGTWVMSALEVDGKLVPEDKIEKATLVIKGDKYTLTTGGKSYETTIILNEAKKPKEIDMTFTEGPNKDKVHKGIYSLEDDTFKLVRGLSPDRARPTDFGTWPDTGIFMVVWKRPSR